MRQAKWVWVGFAASLLCASLEIPVARAINVPGASTPSANYPTRPIRLVVPSSNGRIVRELGLRDAFTLQ